MNDILLLKGKMSFQKAPPRPPVPDFKSGFEIKAIAVARQKVQLEGILNRFTADRKLGGALVGAYYKRVVPKSARLDIMLSLTGNSAAEKTIRGARFEDIVREDGKVKSRHVFTHFLPLESLKKTIENLSWVYNILVNDFDGVASRDDLLGEKMAEVFKSNLTAMRRFRRLIKEIDSIEKFDTANGHVPVEGSAIVTLYQTAVSVKSVLSGYGIDVKDDQILDGTTVRLEIDDIIRLNSKAPFLIAMANRDLNEIPPIEMHDGHGIGPLELPPPEDEPWIGVIDTWFNEKAYFHEWVDNHVVLMPGEVVEPTCCTHGTAVSSIIVDGPSLNPAYDDGCGRFRVRHFGVTSGRGVSVFKLIKDIRDIVTNNLDIKVWNLSLGSPNEVEKNYISPIAAELDRLQYEYDILFVVAGTNVPSSRIGSVDMKVGSPADSLNSLVVNAVNADGNPTSYTRIGPVLSFFYKPDVGCFGGDGTDAPAGVNVCVGETTTYLSGTSFAAPWMARKLAYLIHRMKFQREVAKALIIDSAASWDERRYQKMLRVGYGVVPTKIEKVINGEDDEIKFVISGRTEKYSTYTYQIPVPLVDEKYPFIAKATLVYFPECNRNMGVDYTISELDVRFGRVAGTLQKPEIKTMNNNIQGVDVLGGCFEEDARRLFRKWDNVKHISEVDKPRLRVKKSYAPKMWGLEILSKDRRQKAIRRPLNYGAVLTLKNLHKKNLIEDFIAHCEFMGWIVERVSVNVRAQLSVEGNASVTLD